MRRPTCWRQLSRISRVPHLSATPRAWLSESSSSTPSCCHCSSVAKEWLERRRSRVKIHQNALKNM